MLLKRALALELREPLLFCHSLDAFELCRRINPRPGPASTFGTASAGATGAEARALAENLAVIISHLLTLTAPRT